MTQVTKLKRLERKSHYMLDKPSVTLKKELYKNPLVNKYEVLIDGYVKSHRVKVQKLNGSRVSKWKIFKEFFNQKVSKLKSIN